MESLFFLLLLVPLLRVDLHLSLKLIVDFTLRLTGTGEVKVVELRPLLRKLMIPVEVRHLLLSHISLLYLIDN